MQRIGIVAGVFIIIVAAVFFGFKRAAKNREEEAAKVTQQARATATSTTAEAPGSAAASGSAPAAKTSTIKRIDPTARQKLLDQITAARARRTTTGAGGTTPSSAPPELSKDYIRTQVRELIPLLTECYTKALEDDPKLAGKMVVKFAIGGEPDVGGLVETSEVDAANSTIKHEGMVECVRETMYGAEFVAPSEGGRVEVHYPFEFSNQ